MLLTIAQCLLYPHRGNLELSKKKVAELAAEVERVTAEWQGGKIVRGDDGVFRASFDPGNLYSDWLSKWCDPSHYSHAGRYPFPLPSIHHHQKPRQEQQQQHSGSRQDDTAGFYASASDDDDFDSGSSCDGCVDDALKVDIAGEDEYDRIDQVVTMSSDTES